MYATGVAGEILLFKRILLFLGWVAMGVDDFDGFENLMMFDFDLMMAI